MLPGRMVLTWLGSMDRADAAAGRLEHARHHARNPTSLPPTVIDTSVVWLLRADSWLDMTLLVVAPAQATGRTGGWLALAHRAE
jgi:hypothetical protein